MLICGGDGINKIRTYILTLCYLNNFWDVGIKHNDKETLIFLHAWFLLDFLRGVGINPNPSYEWTCSSIIYWVIGIAK